MSLKIEGNFNQSKITEPFVIINFVTHYKNDSIFSSEQYGHHSEGYTEFRKLAQDRGLKVVENQPITSNSIVIFRDLPELSKVENRPLNCIFILHIWESPLQREYLFNEKNWELFDLVLSSNDKISNDKHRILRYFVDDFDNRATDYIDRKLAVAVCTNRYNGILSARSGSSVKGLPLLQEIDFEWNNNLIEVFFGKSNGLYAFRRKMLLKKNNLFDLFGRFWTSQTLTSWINKFHYFLPNRYESQGELQGDKREIFGRYKYAMSFENYKNNSGYLSEKIFECFQAKCVPLYAGCDNVFDYIPRECFIFVEYNSSSECLKSKLQSITEDEWLDFIAAGQNFLSSDEFINFFTPEAFASNLMEYTLESISIFRAGNLNNAQ